MLQVTPTSIRYANSLPTCVAVYFTVEKKNILIFKSISLCIKYLFPHRIRKKTDESKLFYLIQTKCCQKKEREELNLFSLPFTYRLANDEQKQIIGNSDYIILDERFANDNFLPVKLNGNKLEGVIKIGDDVEILFGRFKGRSTIIRDIKDRLYNRGDAKLEYIVKLDGEEYSYKSNCLKLIYSQYG